MRCAPGPGEAPEPTAFGLGAPAIDHFKRPSARQRMSATSEEDGGGMPGAGRDGRRAAPHTGFACDNQNAHGRGTVQLFQPIVPQSGGRLNLPLRVPRHVGRIIELKYSRLEHGSRPQDSLSWVRCNRT